MFITLNELLDPQPEPTVSKEQTNKTDKENNKPKPKTKTVSTVNPGDIDLPNFILEPLEFDTIDDNCSTKRPKYTTDKRTPSYAQ